MTQRATQPTKRAVDSGPCNPSRFEERVYADYGCKRAFCRCCGRVIGYPSECQVAAGEMDGECRWCELGHLPRVRVERPRLFR